MDAKQCDYCKQYGSGIGWLSLERDFALYEEEPKWHFDSWECLEAFAKTRKELVDQR